MRESILCAKELTTALNRSVLQERCLQMICVRTTALPIGRGSVTLHTG